MGHHIICSVLIALQMGENEMENQTTLLGEVTKPKKKRQWKTKRRIDTVREDCLNCGKSLKFAIFEEADEFDTKTGKPTWDSVFVHGEAKCTCGAEFLIADDLENVNIYWLNKKEMISIVQN